MAKPIDQETKPSRDMFFNRILRNRHARGDLALRKPIDPTQDEGLLRLGGMAPIARCELAQFVAIDRDLFGRRAIVRVLELREVLDRMDRRHRARRRTCFVITDRATWKR
jgi:hypothetical protein